MQPTQSTVKLTEFARGAGCGCKINPTTLAQILAQSGESQHFPNLLVGNSTNDDAAVYALDDEHCIISTTDFFTPIVDDAADFGAIAAANALSDVYAMGGKPIMAVAVLGWPIDKLPTQLAGKVLEGARNVCNKAGVALAGGHSIESPEPFFGLAVTGNVLKQHIKTNTAATKGCKLYLTKPLGSGILSTAMKRGKLRPEDAPSLLNTLTSLNDFGYQAAKIEGVEAMTDVTGFGLLGHLVELCKGSNLSAHINFEAVPTMEALPHYLDQHIFPDATTRNFQAYAANATQLTGPQLITLCDPQTNGGLLLAVNPAAEAEFLAAAKQAQLHLAAFGTLVAPEEKTVTIR